jgi:hypothetical protein
VATTAAATKETARSIYPPWISLKTLSMIGMGSIKSLAEQVLRGEQEDIKKNGPPEDGIRKIDVSDDDDVIAVWGEDIADILGKAAARKVADYQPDFAPLSELGRESLGLASWASDDEVLALLERRGVMIQNQLADRLGFVFLGHILAQECNCPKGEHDWVLWSSAMRYMSEVMRTPIIPAAKKVLSPRPVREPGPWEKPLPVDERRDSFEKVASDHGSGFLERCECMGLRLGQPPDMGYKNEKWVLSFDLFRLLGINSDRCKPPMLYNRRHEPIYLRMQARAYDLALAKR